MSDLLHEGEVLVITLPINFLISIANISDQQIPLIAQEWGKMNELSSRKHPN